MSQWSRDILNDPPLRSYNKSALLGNTFWRVCIPEIQRQSLCGWVRTAAHWWCGFINFMLTCKITSFAANFLGTESQIIDYKYYAQQQVPYHSEGEHYHAYRSSTPLFTSPARWLSKLTRGGPIPYHYSCSEIHLQRHTNAVTSETGTYPITRLDAWTREQQINRSLHRRLNTKITFEHKEQYHNYIISVAGHQRNAKSC